VVFIIFSSPLLYVTFATSFRFSGWYDYNRKSDQEE